MTDGEKIEETMAGIVGVVRDQQKRRKVERIGWIIGAAAIVLLSLVVVQIARHQAKDDAQAEARAQIVAGQQQTIATMQAQIKVINSEREKEGLPPIKTVTPTTPPSSATNQAENVQTIAQLAAALVPPGEQGPTGKTGKAGVSIVSVTQAGCDVVIGTSDGRTYKLTNLCGPTGPTGPSGAVGPSGPQGEPGLDGVDGANGVNGVDGQPGATGPAGPTGASGPAGPSGADGAAGKDGANGKDGRGIASFECDADQPISITVRYDDGTSQTVECTTSTTTPTTVAPTTDPAPTSALPTRNTIPPRG